MVSLRTLSGGLRVALVPCEAESVAFGLFVASGSRHEKARVAGISHFIEHMLFKGTPTRRSIDITRAIEGRGGNFNACTGEESTCYYAHVPYEWLGETVDILSDMYLNASFANDEFVREKQVVLEEIKMYADEPDSVAMENLQRALFPCNPLGAPVAGSAASLGPLSPEDLRRHVKRHYTAATTVAVVAGRFDEVSVLATIDRCLATPLRARRVCLSGACGVPVDFSVPVMDDVSVAKDVQQTQLAIGYRTFGVRDPRKYAAVVMDAILGRGMSSRLFQEVREKRGLSYDISSRIQFFADAGMLTVSAGVDPLKADRAQATIDRECLRLCEKRVSAAELNRTKEYLVGNFRLSHERVVSKMFFHGTTLLSFGRLVTTDEQIEGVRSVTAADVQSVAHAVFSAENRCVSRVVPK